MSGCDCNDVLRQPLYPQLWRGAYTSPGVVKLSPAFSRRSKASGEDQSSQRCSRVRAAREKQPSSPSWPQKQSLLAGYPLKPPHAPACSMTLRLGFAGGHPISSKAEDRQRCRRRHRRYWRAIVSRSQPRAKQLAIEDGGYSRPTRAAGLWPSYYG